MANVCKVTYSSKSILIHAYMHIKRDKVALNIYPEHTGHEVISSKRSHTARGGGKIHSPRSVKIHSYVQLKLI